MEKAKLTKTEICWILYDVGNSAFILLVATLIPLYFNSLAQGAGISEVDYLAYWGYAVSISTILVAVLGPVLGTVADMENLKKPLFLAAVLVGVLGCIALGLPSGWFLFLVVFIVAKVGYNTSLIFYDAMLVDVTRPERFDVVSSNGYAWGYIGSCIPFVFSLALVLLHGSLGISMGTAMMLAFLLNGIWWFLMTLPLLRAYRPGTGAEGADMEPERAAAGRRRRLPKHLARDGFRQLLETFRDIRGQRQIFLYLLSFFFFIDGVYTIIEMATAYGSALGLDSSGLLLALLVTQIVAFPCALIFSAFSGRFETARLLKVCIIAYTGIALFAIQLDRIWEFWLLAVLVGMFQGAIQALSRSYFAKIIPAEKSGEYFGIYDICGKGASFLGTTLVGIVAQITGIPGVGVGVLAVLFVIGYFLFDRSSK